MMRNGWRRGAAEREDAIHLPETVHLSGCSVSRVVDHHDTSTPGPDEMMSMMAAVASHQS